MIGDFQASGHRLTGRMVRPKHTNENEITFARRCGLGPASGHAVACDFEVAWDAQRKQQNTVQLCLDFVHRGNVQTDHLGAAIAAVVRVPLGITKQTAPENVDGVT